MTIVGCVASAIVLLLAPQEPVVWVYNGGDYTFYPSIGLLIAAFAALMISFVGCCGALRDSKSALILVSEQWRLLYWSQNNNLSQYILLPLFHLKIPICVYIVIVE